MSPRPRRPGAGNAAACERGLPRHAVPLSLTPARGHGTPDSPIFHAQRHFKILSNFPFKIISGPAKGCTDCGESSGALQPASPRRCSTRPPNPVGVSLGPLFLTQFTLGIPLPRPFRLLPSGTVPLSLFAFLKLTLLKRTGQELRPRP